MGDQDQVTQDQVTIEDLHDVLEHTELWHRWMRSVLIEGRGMIPPIPVPPNKAIPLKPGRCPAPRPDDDCDKP